MFWKNCSNGTEFSVTFAPGVDASKAAMAVRNPASSLSLPHVVKVRAPASPPSPASGAAGRVNPQADAAAPAVAAPKAARIRP
jgi:hypothetical protein